MSVLCNTLPSLARPVRVPGFHSMKGLGVILLPPGLDSSHLQYSSPPSAQHFIKAGNSLVPIYILGWGEALRNKSIFPRTQHSDLARSQTQSLNPGFTLLTIRPLALSQYSESTINTIHI